VNDVKGRHHREIELEELRNSRRRFEDAARGFETSVNGTVNSVQTEVNKTESELNALAQGAEPPAAPQVRRERSRRATLHASRKDDRLTGLRMTTQDTFISHLVELRDGSSGDSRGDRGVPVPVPWARISTRCSPSR